MRKKIALWCIIIGAICLICSCNLKKNEVVISEEHLPKLRIGCDEYEPYNYLDENGKGTGIDADLAKEACNRMGYEPVFIKLDWTEKDKYLEGGKIDCIWDCFAIDNNENDYLWAGPYMESAKSVMVLKDSSIYTFDDLDEKIIAVQSDSCVENTILRNQISDFPQDKKVYCFKNMEETLSALQQGYVDAAVGDKETLKSYANTFSVDYRILRKDITKEKVGVAFSKNADGSLVEKLNQTLAEMKEDGTIQRILEKYGISSPSDSTGGEQNE